MYLGKPRDTTLCCYAYSKALRSENLQTGFWKASTCIYLVEISATPTQSLTPAEIFDNETNNNYYSQVSVVGGVMVYT